MLNKEIFTWCPKLRFEYLFSSIPSLRLIKGFRLSWVWQDSVEVEKNKSITIWVIPSIFKVWQLRQICTKDLQKDELNFKQCRRVPNSKIFEQDNINIHHIWLFLQVVNKETKTGRFYMFQQKSGGLKADLWGFTKINMPIKIIFQS